MHPSNVEHQNALMPIDQYMREKEAFFFFTNISTKLRLSNVSAAGVQVIS